MIFLEILCGEYIYCRNLYGTSSEESLNSRLRPGVMGMTKSSKSDNNFEAELKRLIDPEKADKDLKGYLVSTNVLYELMFSIRYIFSSPCQRQCELLPSLGIRRLSSVNFSHFNLLL